MFQNKLPMFILTALLGGFALIGLFTLGLTFFALIQGETNLTWNSVVFSLFFLGGVGGAGTLWLAIKKIEKDMLDSLKLDKQG